MRSIINSVLVAVLTATIVNAEEKNMTPPLNGKKVLMIIAANGFQDHEFAPAYDLLPKLGATVKIACSRKDKAIGKYGRQVSPDFALTECKADDYDAVVFIGGPGAAEYFDDPAAHALARGAAAQGKVLGAICIAPAILANAGVLKGKRAAVFPSEENTLASGGALLTRQNVVVDGKIVTAPGPQAAQEFAETLAKLLR
jgi:protease I